MIFNTPPQVTFGRDFRVQIAPTTLFLYSPFVAYLLNSSLTDYDKIVVADDQGHLLRDVSTAYPYSYLDFQTGRFIIDINTPSISNQFMTVSYHSLVRGSCKDLPVGSLTIPAFTKVNLVEQS